MYVILKQIMPKWEIKGAISPYNSFCDGYGNPNASGNSYVTTINIAVAKIKSLFSHAGSHELDEIVAFDKAEVAEAYLGQTNMITVSSFCGLKGRVWGLDIVQADNLNMPHSAIQSLANTSVYDIQPILDASKLLFGTQDKKMFPIIPGGHLPCAKKYIAMQGPAHIYAALAIGIPEDRQNNACLYMEDAGQITNGNDKTKQEIEDNVVKNIASSVIEIGKTHKIKYTFIYTGVKSIIIDEGEVGCALNAVPYITLANNAVTDPLLRGEEEYTVSNWLNDVTH